MLDTTTILNAILLALLAALVAGLWLAAAAGR